MSSNLPTSVPIPHAGLLSALGQGLGGGFQQGVQQAGPLMMKLAMDKQSQFQKETKPYGLDEFGRMMKNAGFKDTDLSQKNIETLLNKTNELSKKVGRKAASQEVLLNSTKYLTDESDSLGEALIEKKAEDQTPYGTRGPSFEPSKEGKRTLLGDIGPGSSFDKGLQSGSSGKLRAVLSGQSIKDYEKASTLKDKAGVWDNVLYTVGSLTSDAPAFIAGAAAGMAGGGPMGSAVGAFALPAFLNSSLENFMKLKEKGGQGSFEDYLNAVGEVASQSTQAGAEGLIFGTLSKVLPIMKAANPAIKKFFEASKFPQLKEILGTSTVQALGLTGAEAVAKRELPSKEDVATNFAQVFGLNLLHLGTNRAKGIIEQVRRSKNPKGPADTIDRIKTAADKAGIDVEKVNAGDSAETRKLNRIVTDITKTYEPKGAEVKLPGKELSKEALEKRAAATKEKAGELAAAPLETYLKEKKPYTSPKMKIEMGVASKELTKVETNIERVQENVNKLNAELEKGIKSEKSRRLIEKTKAGYESQLNELKAKQKELEYVSKKGVKPFNEAESKKMAEDRVKRLEDMTRNPEKYTEADWEKEFKGEAKYLQDQIEILKRTKGAEPIAPYKDRHIKALKTYNNMYADAIKNIDKKLETITNPKEKKLLKKIKADLTRNKHINDARLTKHRDKLSTKATVKNAPALMRHYIQQLKADLPGMQKPIIEYKKAMAEIEGKTEKVAKESLKEGNKLNESVSKSLKGEKISEKVIEAQIDKTLPKETTPGEKKSIIDHLKKAVEVWKSNKGSPDKAIKEMRSIYRDMTLPQRIIVGSIMSAALKGIGVPYWLRLAFVPSGVLERGMTTAVGGYILSKAKGMKEDYLSAKFHALKYPTERRKMRLDLTKKYGTAAAKRIMKVKSSEEEKSVISKFMEAI